MNLKSFHIHNFRRLKDVHVELESETSIFVGANNSGKTSATNAFQLFLGSSSEKFTIYDFSADCWETLDKIGEAVIAGKEVDSDIPTIRLDLWFEVKASDLHRVVDLLPNLEWENSLLGLRMEFAPKDDVVFKAGFRDACIKAKKGARAKTELKAEYHPWPRNMTEYLGKKLGDEFEIRYFVLDRAQFDDDFEQKESCIPLELGNKERSGKSILKSLLKVDFLHAQRHLSDTSSSRSEDLSKRLSRFYKSNLQKREDDFEALRALSDSEGQLNVHLANVFGPTLKRLNELGYPGFSDPHLVIKSALNPESILNQNATVHYALRDPGQTAEGLILPDKYNGLGFKNLIYMVVELLDFHARWVQEEDRPPLHLIIIEEPEAHLHAQLQQVFIRKILDILPKDDGTGAFVSQVVVTTHSPHIIYESGFRPIRYFRRAGGSTSKQVSKVLNLSKFYEVQKGDREFLQRYMKLTHCDLFFADAAVLVEGNVERLLLPLMIGKAAPNLQSCYLSVLEVGGAFAYRFKALLEFLGITALVITDLDSVEPKKAAVAGVGEAEPEEDENAEVGKPGESCMANVPEALTCNRTLIEWLPKLVKVTELLAAEETKKVQMANGLTPANIRVAYQTAQDVHWKVGETDEKISLAGRTLEEAFAFENLAWCQDEVRKHLQLKIPASSSRTLEEMTLRIHKRVKGSCFNKTAFALGLMTEDPKDWKVPRYIEEGLLWLAAQIVPPPLSKDPQPTAEASVATIVQPQGESKP